MKVYDISRALAPSVAVWPGDQPFERDWTSRISDGQPANVGRVRMSLHTGTHADAPFHFRRGGPTIDEVELEVFIGDALVVDAGDISALTVELVSGIEDVPQRVLFRTRHSSVADGRWDSGFAHVDPALADTLAGRGVVLIGTDAPSVDPFDSAELAAHHALADAGIHILENLQLRDVPPGRYLLVAAPLKLNGMDGSPVRAVLLA